MLLPDISKITVDKIHLPEFAEKKIELDILRLDKIHSLISGNKWFKLKYHLENFNEGKYKGILTFGGAWSNHIIATAMTCSLNKIKCIGIIRGEKPTQFSQTLQEALKLNMELKFISRELYRKKNDIEILQQLKEEHPGFYVIPEGGAGSEGEKGAGEILELVNKNSYSHIACAIGTATMFNGISKNVSTDQELIGIPVLKGMKKMDELNNTRIFYDYHFGGYAKFTNELISFMNEFYKQSSIPTDFVYTAKLCFAIIDLLKQNNFPEGSKILIIHSGGLQGNQSLPMGTLNF